MQWIVMTLGSLKLLSHTTITNKLLTTQRSSPMCIGSTNKQSALALLYQIYQWDLLKSNSLQFHVLSIFSHLCVYNQYFVALLSLYKAHYGRLWSDFIRKLWSNISTDHILSSAIWTYLCIYINVHIYIYLIIWMTL